MSLHANMQLRKELAARLRDPAREIPAELLDGPGPRLILEGRFEAAPAHEVSGLLLVAPLYRPSSTLAVHLVLPGTGRFPTPDRLNGRLLLSIRAALARLFDRPSIMAPVFTRIEETALDSLLERHDENGCPETRVLMRAGGLLWDDLCQATGHQRLAIPRLPQVREYRVIADDA